MEQGISLFIDALLGWHNLHYRRFRWREATSLYSVAVAAVLLKRTRAEMVEPVYEELMNRWPTPSQLCEASIEELENLLKPIGLYRRRAKELKRLACFLAEKRSWENPPKGVGPYVCSVIRCFGLGQPTLVVDSNVRRILSRVFGEEAVEALRRSLEKTDSEKAKRINLALIDFGALVCRPKRPRCRECPIRPLCRGAEKSSERAYSSSHSSSSSSSQNSSSPSSSQNSSSPHSSSSSHSSSHSSSSIIG